MAPATFYFLCSTHSSTFNHHTTTKLLNFRHYTNLHSKPYFSNTIKSLSSPTLTQNDLKKLIAEKVVDFVKFGVILGLGTCSTAALVVAQIDELLSSSEFANIVGILTSKRTQEQAASLGIPFSILNGHLGIPTSKRTQEQAASLGIPLSVLNGHPRIDLPIDGTDEVDPDLNLVPRHSGTLLREKMVEAASDKFIAVDDTKLVDGSGGSWFGW